MEVLSWKMNLTWQTIIIVTVMAVNIAKVVNWMVNDQKVVNIVIQTLQLCAAIIQIQGKLLV